MTRIGYIIRSYPRLSQTFIVNEIQALEQLGLKLHIFPIADPREPIVQPQVAAVRAPVEYLEAATKRSTLAILAEQIRAAIASPRRYFLTLRYVLRRHDLDAGYSAGSRYSCFVQAVYLARLLERERRRGEPITHLHAHFAHDPTLIALLAQMLTGITYSFTAHARDLYQIPPHVLAERIERASAAVTCSGNNIGYIDEVVPERLRGKVQLIHHGVNIDGFQPLAKNQERAPVGSTENRPDLGGSGFSALGSRPLILSVGRLVEKKGFPDLLLACAQLKQSGRRFRCAIYGEGPLHDELVVQIGQLGLNGEVVLAGACSQRELIPIFQGADLFVLAPFVTADGDRDGIPNVLVEAMACGLPVVSTTVAGIPELVQPGQNGLLVAPHDVASLTAALAALIDDPERRAQLGAAARQTVVERFDLRAAAGRLAALFEQAAQTNTQAAAEYRPQPVR